MVGKLETQFSARGPTSQHGNYTANKVSDDLYLEVFTWFGLARIGTVGTHFAGGGRLPPPSAFNCGSWG